MNQIEIRKDNIPVKPDQLATFILVGQQAVAHHKARLKAIKHIEMAAAARQAAYDDAESIAEVVIDAEAKLGEILQNTKPIIESSGRGTIEKKKSLPAGIDKKMSHEVQQIHKHPEIVDECKSDARLAGQLITRHKVIKAIKKHKKAKEPKPLPMLDDYIKQTCGIINTLHNRISHIDGNVDNIQSMRLEETFMRDGKELTELMKKVFEDFSQEKPKSKYYVTQRRLSFLRDKVKYIYGLTDVQANCLAPVKTIRNELKKVVDELDKLEPYRK